MAAKPVLASDLITKDSIGLFEERARKRMRVGTGCSVSVDDALSGGLVYGQDGIYNISGATGSRAAETVCLFDSLSSQLFVKNEQERLSEVGDSTRVTPRQLDNTLSTNIPKES
jgi:hypothetical protein